MSGEQFDEQYFETGEASGRSLYTAYAWLPSMTIPMCHWIILELGIRRHDTIVDLGCAKGFLVRAFRLLHYEARGVDISDYARNAAPEDVRPFLHKTLEETPGRMAFDWLISKDTLEHVAYEDLPAMLQSIHRHAKHAFITVPLGDGVNYNFPDYEKDVTHVIRQPLGWWKEQFEQHGFSVKRMATEMPMIKPTRCKNGDGFFVLERR